MKNKQENQNDNLVKLQTAKAKLQSDLAQAETDYAQAGTGIESQDLIQSALSGAVVAARPNKEALAEKIQALRQAVQQIGVDIEAERLEISERLLQSETPRINEAKQRTVAALKALKTALDGERLINTELRHKGYLGAYPAIPDDFTLLYPHGGQNDSFMLNAAIQRRA
jgi:hypothetical protein